MASYHTPHCHHIQLPLPSCTHHGMRSKSFHAMFVIYLFVCRNAPLSTPSALRPLYGLFIVLVAFYLHVFFFLAAALQRIQREPRNRKTAAKYTAKKICINNKCSGWLREKAQLKPTICERERDGESMSKTLNQKFKQYKI